MAVGLPAHKVSLTKNGYFKLINLIRKYPSDEILDHLDEISINRAQARKMLAGNELDELPSVWDEVKELEEPTQDALLLFSIIFSHKDLIKLFQDSTTGEMNGEIWRNSTDGKVYTNLAYSLHVAGLATDFAAGAESTKYDLSPILTTNEIGPLAKVVLKRHLENMGWHEPTDEEPFHRTFEEQIKVYKFHDVLGITSEKFLKWLNGENLPKQAATETKGNPQIIADAFKEAIEKVHLRFPSLLVSRFITSMIAKPFVILSGLSGSGKTKLAQAFVKWISESDKQYCIVPVGADWTNREPLLGYPNALKNDAYEKPENGALNIIIRANKEPRLPFFLILDEMNLSHVERYFADFLSVMESNDNISLFDGEENRDKVPPSIGWPPNLFIIGTVNIDETTYMFSPKVLDRANTIEFRINRGDMQNFLNNISEVKLIELDSKGAEYSTELLNSARDKSLEIDNMEKLNGVLIDFFQELQKSGAEFGYRSATEMIRLIRQLNLTDPELEEDERIDIAIMQKLLPKLHGSRRKLSPILTTLGTFCVKSGIEDIHKDVFTNQDFNFNSDVVKYPLSLEKISRMYEAAQGNGFASYAEA